MGLDMYCYRATRLTDAEKEELNKCKRVSEVPDKFSVFNAPFDENDDTAFMLEDLMPYLYPITLLEEYIDIDSIKQDNGIPEDAIIVGRSFGGSEYKVTFSFSFGEESKTVEMTEKELDKYIFEKDEDCLVGKLSEVAYWRKNYDLQDKIHTLYGDEILNCGYYLLNEEMREAMIEDGELSSCEDSDENSELFYHEWY